jgi:integrase
MSERIEVRIRDKGNGRALSLYWACPLTGREKSKSAGTHDRAEAERAAAMLELELRAKESRSGDLSWEMFRVRFEDEHLVHLAKRSQATYSSALKAFEKHVGLPRRINLIKPETLSQFRAGMASAGLVHSTANNYLRRVMAALSWAEQIGLLSRAPKIKLPQQIKGKRLARARAASEAEYVLLIQSARVLYPEQAAQYALLFALCYLGGLRFGEACQLSWDAPPLRVDLDGSKYPKLVIFADGQKSRQDELSAITPDFAEYLRRTPVEQRTGLVAPIVEDGHTLAARTIERRVSEIGKHTQVITGHDGKKNLGAHDLRRAFGQRWASKVMPAVLQKLMRHKSIETTLKYYVDQQADEIGALLWRTLEAPTSVPEKSRPEPSN